MQRLLDFEMKQVMYHCCVQMAVHAVLELICQGLH